MLHPRTAGWPVEQAAGQAGCEECWAALCPRPVADSNRTPCLLTRRTHLALVRAAEAEFAAASQAESDAGASTAAPGGSDDASAAGDLLVARAATVALGSALAALW